MKADLFTKQQLLNGYLNLANNRLTKVWFASVYFHELDLIHEDLIYDYLYLYYDAEGNLKGGYNQGVPSGKKELSLWDVV